MCNFLQLVTYVQYLLWCFGLNFTFSLCIHRGLANFDPQVGHITRKHKNASRPNSFQTQYLKRRIHGYYFMIAWEQVLELNTCKFWRQVHCLTLCRSRIFQSNTVDSKYRTSQLVYRE